MNGSLSLAPLDLLSLLQGTDHVAQPDELLSFDDLIICFRPEVLIGGAVVARSVTVVLRSKQT